MHTPAYFAAYGGMCSGPKDRAQSFVRALCASNCAETLNPLELFLDGPLVLQRSLDLPDPAPRARSRPERFLA